MAASQSVSRSSSRLVAGMRAIPNDERNYAASPASYLRIVLGLHSKFSSCTQHSLMYRINNESPPNSSSSARNMKCQRL